MIPAEEIVKLLSAHIGERGMAVVFLSGSYSQFGAPDRGTTLKASRVTEQGLVCVVTSDDAEVLLDPACVETVGWQPKPKPADDASTGHYA